MKLVYQTIQQPPIQEDIGYSLLHLLQNIPDGVVVFFPSYNTMETLVNKWVEKGIYEQMVDCKRIYQEPRGSDEAATQQFMEAIEKFGRDCGNIKYINKYKRSNAYKKELKALKKKREEEEKMRKKKGSIHKFLKKPISDKDYSFKSSSDKRMDENEDIDIEGLGIDLQFKSEKGAVFFGVCRGKISEGIDFSDGMSRAVILVGIPFPNQKSAEVHFKKLYNNREAQKVKAKYSPQQQSQTPFTMDGKQWYAQQAYRALNQALGRCIRHKYDFGCIIFLEARFYGTGQYAKRNIDQLSKWVRPNMRASFNVNQAVRELIKPYFEYMKANPPRYIEPGQQKWIPPLEMPKNPWSHTFANPIERYQLHLQQQQQQQQQQQNQNRNGYHNNNSNMTQQYSNRNQYSNNNNNNNYNRALTQQPSNYNYNNHNNHNNHNKNNYDNNQRGFGFKNGNGNGSNQYQNRNHNNNSISPPNRNNNNNNNYQQSKSPPNRFFRNSQNNNNSNNTHKRRFSFDKKQNGNNHVQSPQSVKSRSNVSSINTQSTSTPQTPYDIKARGNNMNNNHNNSNGRKRKREIGDENIDPYNNNNNNNNNKRMKTNQRQNNCAKCNCGNLICRGEFETCELDRGGGNMTQFYASNQPFPCQTASNCLWSSQLGLCFMYKNCDSCKKSVGFHVVAASSADRLEYVGKILFLQTATSLFYQRPYK